MGTVMNCTLIGEENLHDVLWHQFVSVSESSSVIFGSADSNSSPSCDLALLTMAHQSSADYFPINFWGSYQPRQKQMHMWSGGTLLNCSQNAVITWTTVWPVHGHVCTTHLLSTAFQLNNCLYEP
jgi:hypothetical protein